MDAKELILEICKDRVTEKRDLVAELACMSHNEVEEFIKMIRALEHHKVSTCGLYATDKIPNDILSDFWQRTSDACPIECGEAEKQEEEFSEWIDSRFFKIEF